MRFLDNKTDRLMLEYFSKSMSLNDLCKAVGKIPIKKLVYQKGKKPFVNTYYISPEEVNHLNLKSGDKVHQVDMPTHPNKPDDTVTHHFIMNDSNLIDSSTKIEGSFGQYNKDVLKDFVDTSGERVFRQLIEKYEFYSDNLNNPLGSEKHKNSLDELKKFPSKLRLEPHIEELDADNETMTISWKTNLPHQAFISDSHSANSKYLDIISRGLKGDGSIRGYHFDDDNFEENSDGTTTITMKLDTREVSKRLKLQMAKQFADDYVQSVLNTVREKGYKFIPKNDSEKQLNLENCSSEQAAIFRTTGICTDVNDKAAFSYINNLFSSYVTTKAELSEFITRKQKNKFRKNVVDGTKSFVEIRDTLKQYAKSADNLTKTSVEDNEIKCKITSASEEVTKSVSQKVIDDWDNETHGSFKPIIKGVYEVKSLAVDEKFNSYAEDYEDYKDETILGKNCAKDEFYHGTGATATTLILGHSGGFKISDVKAGRLFGRGIYLADKSSKSAQYLSDKSHDFRSLNTRGTLMICDAILGEYAEIHSEDDFDDVFFNNYEMDSDEVDINDEDHPIYEDYDSIVVEGGKGQNMVLNNEFCIFNSDCIRPKYLIDMEIVKTDK